MKRRRTRAIRKTGALSAQAQDKPNGQFFLLKSRDQPEKGGAQATGSDRPSVGPPQQRLTQGEFSARDACPDHWRSLPPPALPVPHA